MPVRAEIMFGGQPFSVRPPIVVNENNSHFTRLDSALESYNQWLDLRAMNPFSEKALSDISVYLTKADWYEAQIRTAGDWITYKYLRNASLYSKLLRSTCPLCIIGYLVSDLVDDRDPNGEIDVGITHPDIRKTTEQLDLDPLVADLVQVCSERYNFRYHCKYRVMSTMLEQLGLMIKNSDPEVTRTKLTTPFGSLSSDLIVQRRDDIVKRTKLLELDRDSSHDEQRVWVDIVRSLIVRWRVRDD